MTVRTHYDVLGLDRQATSIDIRDAYRRLARRHHPDRSTGSAAGGSDEMHAVNEAYRVLRDPGRRAVYDASLRGGSATSPSVATSPNADAPPVVSHPDRPLLDPPRIPWRGIAAFTTLVVVGVFVLAQFSQPNDPQPPDGILRNGDCVEIEDNGDAREVACTGEGDLVVRAFVAFDAPCPNATEAHRDRQGMGVACIERPT